MSELGSMSDNFPGGQYELYSVTGLVIGCVSLFGRSRMLGAVLSGFVVAVIYNGVSHDDLRRAAGHALRTSTPEYRMWQTG